MKTKKELIEKFLFKLEIKNNHNASKLYRYENELKKELISSLFYLDLKEEIKNEALIVLQYHISNYLKRENLKIKKINSKIIKHSFQDFRTLELEIECYSLKEKLYYGLKLNEQT